MEKITAIKQGDARAFAEVFEISYNKTFSFFMSRTCRNRELSKELTQLTYIKVWQSRHTLSELHCIDKQLFVIARSVLIDSLRRKATQQQIKERVGLQLIADGELEESASEAYEISDRVVAILKPLPPTRKKILHMKFVNGYTNREIAGMLSISIKTVEDHVTKGLRELKGSHAMSAAMSVLWLIAENF